MTTMMRFDQFIYAVPAWVLLFIWPVYVLAFLIWLVAGAFVLTVWLVVEAVKVIASAVTIVLYWIAGEKR